MKKRLRLIFAGFCVSFAIMAALSLFALKQFSGLVENSEEVDDTYILISRLYELGNLTKETDILERSYLLTRDSDYLFEMEGLIQKLIPAKDSLGKYISKDPEQKGYATNLGSELVEKRDKVRATILAFDTSMAAPPLALLRDEIAARQRVEQYLSKMRSRAHKALKEHAKVKIYYQEVTFSSIRYLLTIFAFITLVLFFFMIRELKRRMAFQEELQMKVADLKRSHAELEQIAYAVSHDLQEPLRKIQIFSNRLSLKKKDRLDEESILTLDRINSSASRMHELIDDLMNLTNLLQDEHTEPADLNELLQLVLGDLDERIHESGATIQAEVMPVISGHRKQIQLLLRSLIDNALKFAQENKKPVVSIRHDRVNALELRDYNITVPDEQLFDRITIADNGIGFEDKFINKMFQIFQSLHNKESGYSGKGIGLAICQRVMANHGGYIIAHGRPQIGATFRLYFPIKN